MDLSSLPVCLPASQPTLALLIKMFLYAGCSLFAFRAPWIPLYHSVEVFWIKIFKMNELREKKSQSTLTVILKWNETNGIIEIIRHLHTRDDFTGIYVCVWKGVDSNSIASRMYGHMAQWNKCMIQWRTMNSNLWTQSDIFYFPERHRYIT